MRESFAFIPHLTSPPSLLYLSFFISFYFVTFVTNVIDRKLIFNVNFGLLFLGIRSFSFFVQLPNLKTKGHKMRYKILINRPFQKCIFHLTKIM